MDEEMLKWAKERYDDMCCKHNLALHNSYIAHRDLMGVRNGRPTGACLERFEEWKKEKK